jgi:hypothetical protein
MEFCIGAGGPVWLVRGVLRDSGQQMTHIALGCWLADGWFVEKLGRGRPNPVTTSLADVASYEQDRARITYEHLGELGLGRPDPALEYAVPQHDGRNVIAAAFGAAYPEWDELSGCFILPLNAHPWAGLDTVAAVERLPVPDWEQNPLVQENRRKWEETKALIGPESAAQMPLNWTELEWTHPRTGQSYRMSCFPSFLDLGGFLMGSTEFLSVLAADPELAEALLRKCFELSASYSDCMCEIYGRPRTSWCSLGGDNSCLVSADMYRAYAMAFDKLVRRKCGNVPRNLHSCGASKHLYEVWREYPEREQIVLMQTRAIPGAINPLRASLPGTYIQLTIHQPQVDFERETPDRIKTLVWELAEALDFRDISLTVLFSKVDAQCKANLAAFFEAGREVNAEAQRRGLE